MSNRVFSSTETLQWTHSLVMKISTVTKKRRFVVISEWLQMYRRTVAPTRSNDPRVWTRQSRRGARSGRSTTPTTTTSTTTARPSALSTTTSRGSCSWALRSKEEEHVRASAHISASSSDAGETFERPRNSSASGTDRHLIGHYFRLNVWQLNRQTNQNKSEQIWRTGVPSRSDHSKASILREL